MEEPRPMEAAKDKEKITFEIVRLKANVEQWQLISVITEGGARDRLANLDGQLAYGRRRLAELDAQPESRPRDY